MRIQLLGKATFFGPTGRVVTGLPKKAFLVAAVVACSPRQICSKPELSELLWPNLPSGQRANNLRQLLFRVRQFETLQGHALFDTDEDQISLNAGVDCDLVEFERATGTVVTAELLLQTYQGPFLDGHLSVGAILRHWVSDQRIRLEDRFVDTLLTCIEGLPSEVRRTTLGLAIKAAPAAIAPRKALMRQLIADGSTQEARRQFREIEQIGGHGVVAVPPELVAELVPARPRSASHLSVPLAQLGRDKAGVPHLALLPPRGGASAGGEHEMAEALIDDVTIALTRLRSVSILAPHTARRVASGDDAAGALGRADFIGPRSLRRVREGEARPV